MRAAKLSNVMSMAEVQTLEVSIRFDISQGCLFQAEITRRIHCPNSGF
jgi:hypothetical protein